MKKNNSARKYKSRLVSELINEITPVEKTQANTKMTLAARLDDLIATKGLGKKEFAEKVNKNPSEITKWLSGTHNFTIDTLVEIAVALDISVSDLLAPKKIQVVRRGNIVIKGERIQPGIPYYTLKDSAIFATEHYHMEVRRNELHIVKTSS